MGGHTHNSVGKGIMRILFGTLDITYCIIPAADCGFQGEQSLQENKEFINWMSIKQFIFQKMKQWKAVSSDTKILRHIT